MIITARAVESLPTPASHYTKLIGLLCFLITMACFFYFFQDMCLVTLPSPLSSPSTSSSSTTTDPISFLQSKTLHRNKESQKIMMAAMARQNSPSTLDTSDLLSFEVCGGSGGNGEESVASLKLSLMHGLALASVCCGLLLFILFC